MPVYLKQWRDGDFTLLCADDPEDAARILDLEACAEPHTVLRFDAGDLHINFKELIGKAVDNEMTVRKESKLDTRLKARQRRIARALGKR